MSPDPYPPVRGALDERPAALESLGWLLLLALGLAVRCRQYLGGVSYWYDEAYLLVNVLDRPCAELLGAVRCRVVAPPLFLWTLRGLYVHLGAAEWVMRLPSAVAGVASLLLMAPLARRFVGRPGWLWAFALCALSHQAMMHGYEVRPYTTDLLLTEVILLASWSCLGPDGGGRVPGMLALGALALGAPWLSFPSAFVLASASLALLVGAWRRGTGWAAWAAFNGLFLASAAALWYAHARHLYYPGLRQHWTEGWSGFPGGYAPADLLWWTGRCWVGLGHYALTGLGLPLAALALVGLVVLGRRSPALLVLVAGPVVLGWLAALLRRYPMGDRTVVFAFPCLWLPAALGMASLARRLGRAGPLLMAGLLVPGLLRTGYYVAVVKPKTEYREAFAYVHRHWRPGDTLWAGHPEIHEVYYGKSAVLGPADPADAAARAAQAGRLWMVYTCQTPNTVSFRDVFDRLDAARLTPSRRARLRGVEVVLYEPAGPGP